MCEIKKLTIIMVLLITIVLSANLINAIGISNIEPEKITLLPGQNANFSLEVFAPSDSDILCKPGINESFQFAVEFNDAEITIKADKSYVFNGKVSFPAQEKISPGNYQSHTCISCTPIIGEATGSTVRHNLCTPILNIEVPGKIEESQKSNFLILVIVIIIILVLIALSIFFLYRKRKLK